MNYVEFAKSNPILYGQIIVNKKSKIGQFKADWQGLSNSVVYTYYTHAGNKGQGGFSLLRAYNLFTAGRLTVNPEHGNPDNYL